MKQATNFLVALALLLPPAARAETQRARYLMGTVCEVAVGGAGAERAIEAAFAEAERVEAMLSTWLPASELSRVNRGEAEPSPELAMLLARASDWSRRTAGAFDPRVGDLVALWRVREEGAIPDAEALARALPANARPPRVEEGAFGKGYALDRMLTAIGRPAMIDFGGQIAVRGSVVVSIADPVDRDRPVATFTLRDGSVSTTSGSEKTFLAGGRRLSHIIDPRHGQALPPRGSVSVIADEALTADILSTALYVMGEDDGLRWADANDVAAVFINPSKHIRLSARARERARDLEVLDRNFKLKE